MDRKNENGRAAASQSFQDYLNSDEFIRQLAVDHGYDRENGTGYDAPDQSSDALRTPNRPRLSNKSMLRGLVERTECFNKSLNRRITPNSSLALEEERKMHESMESEMKKLAVSNQHIPLRGRGDCFGKMRSVDSDNEHSTDGAQSFNNNGPLKKTPSTSSPSSPKAQLVPHQFDPSTAYNGRVAPDYRYTYKPEAVELSPIGVRSGARYPKRPENGSQISSQPKHLNHNYYNIVLYGDAQNERNAQRIEKTVRQTEDPSRF